MGVHKKKESVAPHSPKSGKQKVKNKKVPSTVDSEGSIDSEKEPVPDRLPNPVPILPPNLMYTEKDSDSSNKAKKFQENVEKKNVFMTVDITKDAPNVQKFGQVSIDDWKVPEDILQNPFFVLITRKESLVDALRRLSDQIRNKTGYEIISKKIAHTANFIFAGRLLETGKIGIYRKAGRVKLITKPGYYWNWNIFAKMKFMGSYDMTSEIDVLGLTIAQVSQSEAIVAIDSHNRVFIVRNGGFCASGEYGRFKVLAIIVFYQHLNKGHEKSRCEKRYL
jgi:hypothetical protein